MSEGKYVGEIYEEEKNAFMEIWNQVKRYITRDKFDLIDLISFGELVSQLLEIQKYFKCFSEIRLDSSDYLLYDS
jgi:hypothetical protein